MKQLVLAGRIIFGAWMLISGANYFFLSLWPVPTSHEPLAAELLGAFAHSGQLGVAMLIQLVTGAFILTGVFAPAALCVVMPTTGVALYWALLEHQPLLLILALVAFALNGFLMLAYLGYYRGTLQPSALTIGESGRAMTWNTLFVDHKGRTSREHFMAALIPLAFVVWFYTRSGPDQYGLWGVIVLLFPAVVLHARRLHDMGHSGWLLARAGRPDLGRHGDLGSSARFRPTAQLWCAACGRDRLRRLCPVGLHRQESGRSQQLRAVGDCLEERRGGTRGMLVQFEISSELLDKPRRVWLQPAAAGPVADCLIFLDAEFYIERVQSLAIVADLQRAGRLPPAASVYVSHVDGVARSTDLTCNRAFTSFVAKDLRRWIEQTVGHFERYFLCGLSLSGLAAIFAALQHPTAFCGILAQSPSVWWDDERLLSSLTSDSTSDSRVWISVGSEENQENVVHSPAGLFQKASQRDCVRRFAEKLAGLCREVHHQEFSGGHDMARWAEELSRALPWLMPRPNGTSAQVMAQI